MYSIGLVLFARTEAAYKSLEGISRFITLV
jgi:hypothetical protein